MAVPKATTIKEAIKRFEERFKCNAVDSKEVQLQFQWPPIEKLDPQLGTLVKCEWVLRCKKVSKLLTNSISTQEAEYVDKHDRQDNRLEWNEKFEDPVDWQKLHQNYFWSGE